MDLKQLYEECCKMQVGEKKQFELDQIPQRGELAAVVARLAVLKNKAVSLARSDTIVYAHCFLLELSKPQHF